MNSTRDPRSADTTRSSAVPDEELQASLPIAKAALLDVADSSSVGVPAGSKSEGDHVFSLYFECLLGGYPGWHWAVTLSHINDEASASVLEVGLTPGSDALVAPVWVPWSDDTVGEGDWSESGLESSDDARADADKPEVPNGEGETRLRSGDIDGVDIDDIDAERG